MTIVVKPRPNAMQAPLSRETAERAVKAVEEAIAAGGVWPLARGDLRPSAADAAAAHLGLPRATLRHRLARAHELYGLAPNGIPPLPPGPPRADKAGKPPTPAADPVQLQRLRDANARLSTEKRDIARRAAKAEDLRSAVFGLTAEPLPPVSFPPREGGDALAETIVLFLSDLHWGETVSLDSMDGLNSFDLAIARARLGRWAEAVVDLSTDHWSGPPPARIILILGGDLVSGEIHAELAKTNEAKALPAVRDLVAHLTAAVRRIRSIGAPVDIISLPGNHGRSTLKPESKESAETSYDTLACDFLETTLASDEGVTFWKPHSGDARFSIYGWNIFATHGDRVGSRGGQGFIGPAATAARGMKRIQMDYATRGQMLDLMLIGHFHTPLMLEEGFVNGSLPGPTEYSRDGRFRPHPAQQLFLTIHPRRKVAQIRWIHVGAPEEGSLYEAPPPVPPGKPRRSITAATG